MTALVENMLLLARTDSGVVQLERVPLDLGDIAAEAASVLTTLGQERGVSVVLAVLTADCLPILLCAEDGSAIAVAHAGWRGLASGVIEATIARLGVPGARLLAWLGPAIAAGSYEVGAEVRAAFVDAHPSAAAAFAPTRPGHWRCDLYALARQRLAAAGVSSVYGGDFDTCTDARFYSYRRDRETGLSLIHI